MQSAFDGVELLARPGIELITVDSSAVREAERRIPACEHCRPTEAEVPFDWILADFLGKREACEFVLAEAARCPNCATELTEKTLIAPQGGVEVETLA